MLFTKHVVTVDINNANGTMIIVGVTSMIMMIIIGITMVINKDIAMIRCSDHDHELRTAF